MYPILFKNRVVMAILLVCLATSGTVLARDPYYHALKFGKSSVSSTGFSGTGSNINVLYQRINWTMTPQTNKVITGTVVIKFLTTINFVSTLNFDLNKASFNNAGLSVVYHGTTLAAANRTFPTTGNVNILNITLPLGTSIPINTVDSITINYSGTPPAVSGQAEGFQRKQDAASNWYLYSLSESYEDRDWWPCKADMQDKIDSMDISITVPNGYRAVTNGKFIDSNLSGANRIFRWKTQYPIASYLVAVGVAKYNVYNRTPVVVGGTSVPVNYFLFPGKTAATYTSILSALDKASLEVTAFSAKFGDYPFKNEKHGYYEFGWGGGMEHQSLSAMGSSTLTNWGIIAHELGHQWFGDKVTFATWNHLWLAEGFARYMEALAAELVPSLGQNPVTVRSGMRTAAMNTTNAPYGAFIPNATIATSNTLWNSVYGTTVYERGAMIVSMLRKLMGDAKFYQALQNYMNDPALAYKSAVTDDLKNHFNALAGADLTEFFNDFVIGNYHPVYQINYGVNNKRVNFRVQSQTKNAASTVSYYNAPIVLKIANAANTYDTTVVIWDKGGGNLAYAGNGIGATMTGNTIGFNLSFVPSTISFDPDFTTLTSGTVTYLNTLAINITNFSLSQGTTSNTLKLDLAAGYETDQVVLEKSNDNKNFTPLGKMLMQATEGGKKEFRLNHQPGNEAMTYYRAKITDVDGTVQYSSVLKAAGRLSSQVILQPSTPTTSMKIVVPSNLNGKQIQARVIASDGALVRNASIKIMNNQFSINVHDLHAGAYWLELTDGKAFRTTKSFSVTH